MLKKIFLLLLVCISLTAFAQKQNVYYLKNDQSRVDTKDSADYVRVVREPDSGSVYYNVLEFYKNGTHKLVGKSSKIEYNSLQGQCVEYYQNGKRKFFAAYKDGVIINNAYEYFPNGKLQSVKAYPADIKNTEPNQDDSSNEGTRILACYDSTGKALVTDGNGYYVGYHPNFKVYEEGYIKNGMRDSTWKGFADKEQNQAFVESYKNGKLLWGTSSDAAGTYNYKIRVIQPAYKNGLNAFYQYLGNNIEYPYDAKHKNITGLVILSFVVEKTGHVSDIKVLKHVSDDIDAEAKRVIAKSKDWVPGMRFGKAVRVVYTSPINFSLKD